MPPSKLLFARVKEFASTEEDPVWILLFPLVFAVVALLPVVAEVFMRFDIVAPLVWVVVFCVFWVVCVVDEELAPFPEVVLFVLQLVVHERALSGRIISPFRFPSIFTTANSTCPSKLLLANASEFASTLALPVVIVLAPDVFWLAVLLPELAESCSVFPTPAVFCWVVALVEFCVALVVFVESAPLFVVVLVLLAVQCIMQLAGRSKIISPF